VSSHYRLKTRLGKKLQAEGCCGSETVSAFFTDQGDPLDWIATDLGLDTVRQSWVDKTRQELRQETARLLPYGDSFRVWRCGPFRGDVTAVTTDRRVAERGCKGGYYTYGSKATVYEVDRSDVLVDIQALWPHGYQEREWLVRPRALRRK